MNEYLEFAKQIALEAKDIMIKYFNKNNGSSYKLDKTIVTKADTSINSMLIEKVKKSFPTHSVDGEEEKFGKSDYVWVCDPVDGTAMYARHIPVAVFSLALVYKGKPIVGVVYDPFTQNMYYASEGNGAYKNNERIYVNEYRLSDMQSVSNYDMWKSAEYNMYRVIEKLDTYFVSLGSVIRGCMCVASGEFSVSLFPGTKHKNCDIAAVKVIVEEAGGIVRDFNGNDQRYDQDINGAIISNKVVYDEVLEAVKKYSKR